MSFDVQVFRDIEEIELLRRDWMRLQWHPNADIDYYRAVLESMPQGVQPYVLALFREGVAEAILAGRIEKRRMWIQIGYASVPGPKTRELVFVHGGLLGKPGTAECSLLAKAIFNSLRSGEADSMHFNHLRTDSPLYACVDKRGELFSALQTHRALTVPDTEEKFWVRFSAKVRKNLKWQMRRFERNFPYNIRIERMGNTRDLDRLIAEIEHVAAKTYQRGLGAGFNASAAERARLKLKAEKGWLCAWVLYVKSVPCSFWGGTLYHGVFHSDWMGYDPEFRMFSPGMYLILRVIESLCCESREVKRIDFGLGDAEYKRLLSDCEWQDGSPVRFAPNLRGALLNTYWTPLVTVDRIGRALLSNSFQQRLKHAWRNFLAEGQKDGVSSEIKGSANTNTAAHT